MFNKIYIIFIYKFKNVKGRIVQKKHFLKMTQHMLGKISKNLNAKVNRIFEIFFYTVNKIYVFVVLKLIFGYQDEAN